ncbi:MAG TPA: type II secretion system F family protein [Candidatus Saccharimonadales bacterium]
MRIKKRHVSSKYREYFTAELAQLIAAAVPLHEALYSLQATSRSRSLRRVLAQMQRDIDEGEPLYKALRRSDLVTGQTLALVQFGEQSGNLSENLALAAKQEEKQRVLRAKLGSALTYPMFVLAVTVLVGIGVATFLLPRLTATFSQLHTELPWITKVMVGVGTVLGAHGWWAVPLFFLTCIAVGYVLFVAKPSRGVGRLMLFYVPGASRLIHQVDVSLFGYLAGTLLSAGLPVTQTLELMEQATESPPYKRLYRQMAQALANGDSFKTIFAREPAIARLLPAPVQQMIVAGEQSGNLPGTLMVISRSYEDKADVSMRNLEAILEPVLLIIVWFGVMGVAVAVILPIYQLVSGLTV